MTTGPKKIAVACQGGGTHGAFAAGVLTAVLRDLEREPRFELVGLSGTSAGALCAIMAGYGLMPKKSRPGSGTVGEAIEQLRTFWDGFAANTDAERMHNAFCQWLLKAQEQEVPLLGINVPGININPYGVLDDLAVFELHALGARKQYYAFGAMLRAACPEFGDVDWKRVRTRVLLGASGVLGGVETVFDSFRNGDVPVDQTVSHRWRARRKLTLESVAASGTLPLVREAEEIDGEYYWDGLYSQNPPIRDFLSGVPKENTPDEIWVVRINPQQFLEQTPPTTYAKIRDRENELMGNLSLNKELDFVLTLNAMIERYGGKLADDYKPVTIRTIKMQREMARDLRTSTKLDRSRSFLERLWAEGEAQGRAFLDGWPLDVGRYPDDAAYPRS